MIAWFRAWRVRRWQRRQPPSYTQQIQRWGAQPSEITPLALPPIKQLKAQKATDVHVVQGRFGS